MKDATAKLVLILLLAVPASLAIYTPLYNRITPTLGGVPFFYWFQILLLTLCVIPYVAFTYVEKKREELPRTAR